MSSKESDTGLAVLILKDIYPRLLLCDSLSLIETSLEVGVIDNDYQGEITSLMYYISKKKFEIHEG